jgi:iron complex transport system substrate-binding protein
MLINKWVSALCGVACGAVLVVAPALGEPFTVTDMTGRDVKFEKPAERIIVFPVPWSSTVIALDGSADKLVAVHPEAKIAIDEGVLAEFYPRVKELPSDILSGGADKGFMPNVEAVAALKPDLVAQWGKRKDDFVSPLANAGITTGAIVYGAEDNARQIMTFIAKSMGLEDKLGTLMQWRDDTAKVLADGLSGVAEADKPKVAYFFYTTPEFHTEGKGSYMNWQINLAGGVNAAQEIDGNGAVSLEQIAKWDPDVILLGSFEPKVSVSRIYDDPILGGTKAAKSNRVYKVPVGGYRWDPPSHESPLMWMWLSSILHPDRFTFDVRATAGEWYKKIYGQDLTQEQLDRILQLEMNAKGAGYERFARK